MATFKTAAQAIQILEQGARFCQDVTNRYVKQLGQDVRFIADTEEFVREAARKFVFEFARDLLTRSLESVAVEQLWKVAVQHAFRGARYPNTDRWNQQVVAAWAEVAVLIGGEP